MGLKLIFPWAPTDRDGVSERALGIFTNAKIRAASYKLEPGSSFTADGRGILMVVSGQGTVGGQPYGDQTVVYLDDDEQATYSAHQPTEVLLMGLPSHAFFLRAAEAANADTSGELAESSR